MQPFYLGSVRAKQDSLFRLTEAGKLDYKGRVEYTYSYPAVFNNPYLLGEVYFKNLALTYVNDTLIRIMFMNIYTPGIYPDYDKKAKREFRQLCKFLKEQWNSPGEEKKFLQSPDKRIISEGLQWNTNNSSMKLALYEDKNKANRQYDISITLELSKYD